MNLESSPSDALPYFTLFPMGRHFSGKAGIELLGTLIDFPVCQKEHQNASEHHVVQQPVSDIAIMADEYCK